MSSEGELAIELLPTGGTAIAGVGVGLYVFLQVGLDLEFLVTNSTHKHGAI